MAKILTLQGPFVTHYVILRDDGIDLIDTGFLGGLGRVCRAIKSEGRELSEVSNLYLTHGHLDHTFHAARFKKVLQCQVHAPLADRAHLEGCHRFQGWSRVTGILESLGRFVFRDQPAIVDHWFEPGEILGGFEVFGLPGHTVGHCGLLDPEEKVLFAGDLFANHFGRPMLPPRIFNDDEEVVRESVQLAARLDLNGVRLNHTRNQTPAENLEDLHRLATKLSPPDPPAGSP